MGLAFWRSSKRAADAAAKTAARPSPTSDDDDPRNDPAASLRARARHRLIGASALLLAVAIVVPMVLDSEPKPVSENIPIDIPSERAPFTPRLSLPPVPPSESAAPTAEPAPAASPEKAVTKAEPKNERKPVPEAESKAPPKAEAKPEVKAQAAKPEEPRKTAEPALPAAVKGGKFAVQAAAPANPKSARDLAERLKKAGFTAYTEKVDTKDGARYRVRVGPYASRDDAERARSLLKDQQGLSGQVVPL